MAICGKRYLVAALLVVVCGVGLVRAHSWIACTDYAEKNAATWDPNKCRGFPRNAAVSVPKTGKFGADLGYDHIPSNTNACGQKKRTYASDHPMAVYYPGQQVVIVHPMKNHGADSACGNIWIPDHGSWIYRTAGSPSNKDPTVEEFRKKLVADLGRSPRGADFGSEHGLSSRYPKPGFQNAPKFCENTNTAVATYSFNVPRNLRPGVYTFMWLWSFNSANNLYSTCFEVQIVRNKAARDRSLRANGFTDLTEPCGGLTSNPDVMGNSNPGCTRQPAFSYAAVAGVRPSEVPEAAPERGTTTSDDTTSTYWWQTTNNQNRQTNNQNRQTTTPYYWERQTTRRAASVTTPATPFWWQYTSTDQASEPESLAPAATTRSPHRRPPKPTSIFMSIDVHMMSSQFSGEMRLPVARGNAIRRYVSADFTCDLTSASFWNAMTISDMEESLRSNHFELVQQGSKELRTNRIFYHVTFSSSCDLSQHAPVVRLLREDLN